MTRGVRKTFYVFRAAFNVACRVAFAARSMSRARCRPRHETCALRNAQWDPEFNTITNSVKRYLTFMLETLATQHDGLGVSGQPLGAALDAQGLVEARGGRLVALHPWRAPEVAVGFCLAA